MTCTTTVNEPSEVVMFMTKMRGHKQSCFPILSMFFQQIYLQTWINLMLSITVLTFLIPTVVFCVAIFIAKITMVKWFSLKVTIFLEVIYPLTNRTMSKFGFILKLTRIRVFFFEFPKLIVCFLL